MSEAAKNKHRVMHLLEGNGVDIGCGDDKIVEHAIGVDMVRRKENINWILDVRKGLPFKDGTLDWVHSSHTLEDIQDTKAALTEWWRVLVPGRGRLILYLPHKHYYPNIGQPHANAGHKHDFLPIDVIAVMAHVGEYDLEVDQVFAPPNGVYDYENRGKIEYSFLQIYRKIK